LPDKRLRNALRRSVAAAGATARARRFVSHRQERRPHTAGRRGHAGRGTTHTEERAVKSMVAAGTRALAGLLSKGAPYVLLEILLPGGTLFALLLFLYTRRRPGAARVQDPRAIVVSAVERVRSGVVSAIETGAGASVWRRGSRERDGLEALAMAPAA
jgi:hypothetical protein